jgi:TolA-binding protein
VPNETGQAMQRDIRRLSEDVGHNQKKIDEQGAQLEEQLAEADKKVASKVGEVDAKLQDLNRAARKTDAGFGVRLDEQQQELQALRGQNELLQYRITQLEKKLEGYDDLTARVETLENGLPAGGTPAAAATPADTAAKTPSAEIPTDKAGLLAHGRKLMGDKKLEEARGVFRELIRRFPTEAGFADEAYFQIGESYFKEKKYRPGLQEYIQVVEKFPKGDLVDDAYFRIGLCSVELGNLEDALIFFDEIIKHHPKSPLVKSAKKKQKDVSKRLERETKK